ncbi:MAG: beta-ketoacyl-[acyl-carrier-protein] synthase II [Idiomarina sp. 34-48-12]|nr:MAG: beta-ketoacyl-[acyl-carrier-protein] synthase II [Idiomarina sp. 34-48-12]
MLLNHLGIVCALGNNAQHVWQAAVSGSRAGMVMSDLAINNGAAQIAGQVADEALPSLSQLPAHMATRNNQLAAAAYQQIQDAVTQVKERYGAERIGVVIGSSTSGIREGESALAHFQQHQELPEHFNYSMQEMSAPADYIAWAAGVTGPCYSISTACSSSARALMSARNMLRANIVDAVIVGGVDSLCRLTLNGFAALESTSSGYCQPFSKNRDGINIGEGAALFLATRELLGTNTKAVELAGAGHSSDAYHMTAPEPAGRGAIAAISAALAEANITAAELDYINLHGTATPLNDAMESRAITIIGAAQVPASSTKAITGHTLGAAGAIEAALCWLALTENTGELPLHVWDGEVDADLPPIQLHQHQQPGMPLRYCLSNSFAFGGNNVALVLSRKPTGDSN